MLFVSRHIGISGYGVVDTDDGSEEVVTSSEAAYYTEVLGLDIKGVARRHDSNAVSLEPYQSVETMTPLQVKTNLINHVDVRTFGSAITLLTFREEEITSPVTVRLSDFGDTLEDCILSENKCSGSYKIILIIDDGIKSLTEQSLRMGMYGWGAELGGLGEDGLGVVIDIRELSDDDLAFKVYEQVYAYGDAPIDEMKDSDERKERMCKLLVSR